MRTAIGIVRKSEKSHEEDTRAAQRERIEQYCESEGIHLLRVVDEKDVSGGKELAKRHGLRGAIEAVEAGEAGHPGERAHAPVRLADAVSTGAQ
jgi:DNA invertase Pin-like site-specific DNA recombinase